MAHKIEPIANCRVCGKPSSRVIERKIKHVTVFIGYCEFHAIIAEQLFTHTRNRREIKGGLGLA